MSAQYRTEQSKLVKKYCRMFKVNESDLKTGQTWNRLGFWEWSVWHPDRPDLPIWGMDLDVDWKDGPTQDLPRWATRPPKTVLVSRRKR